jgi:cytochrome c biogenesis protein CcmG/thiol:disulfide interchange protein DsbE
VTRYFVCLCLAVSPACAKGLTAQQVLDKLVSTYSGLQAVHAIAVREETRVTASQSQGASLECELADASGGRYYARLKQPRQQALAINDGTNIWLALDSKKQWSRVSATAATEDTDEEHDAQVASRDLHDSLENIVLHQFLDLAKTLQDPVIERAQDFELARGKVRCYTIRGHVSGADVELLVDQQLFVVWQYKEKSPAPGGSTEVTVNVKLMELNQDVNGSLFHFEPEPGWTEVGKLASAAVPIRAGERAADFSVKTLDGELVTLSGLRGNIIVLDFWATWCVPCRAEMPAMEKIRAEFGAAVRFYAISDEDTAIVRKFIEENRLGMPVLIDGNREVHRRYGVHKIPALFVIDGDSIVRCQLTGARTESELRDAVRSAVDRH